MKEAGVFFFEKKKQKTFISLGFVLLTAAAPLSPERSSYLEGCGGCHGIDGQSYAPKVPDLTRQAGYFLCTPEGRRYILRLPNVAFSHLDNAQLAATMNYVVFTLGEGTAPAGAKPITEAEIAAVRGTPIDDPDLLRVRAGIVAGILRACPAARGLLAYGAP